METEKRDRGGATPGLSEIECGAGFSELFEANRQRLPQEIDDDEMEVARVDKAVLPERPIRWPCSLASRQVKNGELNWIGRKLRR